MRRRLKRYFTLSCAGKETFPKANSSKMSQITSFLIGLAGPLPQE
jgi:hypothetical protein